jgi:hypothetical protein
MQEKSLIKKNILQFLENKEISKHKFYQDTGITRGILDQNNGMSEETMMSSERAMRFRMQKEMH